MHCFARSDRRKIVSTISVENSRSLWSHVYEHRVGLIQRYTASAVIRISRTFPQRVHIKVVVQVLRCAFGNFCLVFDDAILTLTIVQPPDREFDTRTHCVCVCVVCLFTMRVANVHRSIKTEQA